ncbi:MAG TPA: zincin-like metallopeptidase domain-containing protein [Fimbriimonadaceae bacterium]|nr:zincin-like metallopeptidase domain-containing protein [Fimbriimonadaceae bacterium]
MSTAIYESVTNRIVEALKEGVVPWKKPWHTLSSLPVNTITQKPYRGINPFLLSLAPHTDHRWLTFKQLGLRGGTVRKGERASMVVFWKHWEPPADATDEEAEAGRKQHRIPLLRYYLVFNLEQCEAHGFPELYVPPNPTEPERFTAARMIASSMPNPPRQIEGKNAWYRPADDLVQVPPPQAFDRGDDYFATLFHELAHATGHESRLNRPGVTGQVQFGSGEYSKEELVAELTSAFCCAASRLDTSVTESAASYISGWLELIQSDPKAMVIAAAQAQKAADYIQGVTYP